MNFPALLITPLVKILVGGLPTNSCGNNPEDTCLSSLDRISESGVNPPFRFKENAYNQFNFYFYPIRATPIYEDVNGTDATVGRKHFSISAIKEIENSKWDVWTMSHDSNSVTNVKVTVTNSP